MSATSVGVAPSGECLRSKGRYGSCRWQVKLCDPLAIGPYLSALEVRFMTKRCTNRCSLLYFNFTLSMVYSMLGAIHSNTVPNELQQVAQLWQTDRASTAILRGRSI